MRALLLLVILLASGCVAPAVHPEERPAGFATLAGVAGPVSLGPQAGHAMEPSLAMRGDAIVIAAHTEMPGTEPGQARVFAIVVHRSTDGGATWSSAPLPRDVTSPFDPLGRMRYSGDSVLAFAPSGALYLAGVALDGVGDAAVLGQNTDFTVFVTRSDDQGATWSPAVFHVRGAGPALALAQDKPWLSVDPEGSLRLVWTEFVQSLTLIQYARSDDGGATWSAPRTLALNSAQEMNQVTGATLATPGGGRVYLSYTDIRNEPWPPTAPVASRQLAFWSADGGATFQGPLVVGPSVFPRFGRVVADPRDPLHAAVLASDDAAQPRVYLRETRDGGASWGPRLDLAPQRAGAQQLPTGWFGPDGRLHVAYYDAGWPGGERVVLDTLEGGALVAEQPAPGPSIAPGPYRREYFGLDGEGSRVWAAWVAGDGGTGDSVAVLTGTDGTGTYVAAAPFDV